MDSRLSSTEATGVTIQEAIDAGLKTLKAQPDEVIIEVLEEPSRGVLGIGARLAKVRLQVLFRRSAPAPSAAVVAPPSEPSAKPANTERRRDEQRPSRENKTNRDATSTRDNNKQNQRTNTNTPQRDPRDSRDLRLTTMPNPQRQNQTQRRRDGQRPVENQNEQRLLERYNRQDDTPRRETTPIPELDRDSSPYITPPTPTSTQTGNRDNNNRQRNQSQNSNNRNERNERNSESSRQRGGNKDRNRDGRRRNERPAQPIEDRLPFFAEEDEDGDVMHDMGTMLNEVDFPQEIGSARQILLELAQKMGITEASVSVRRLDTNNQDLSTYLLNLSATYELTEFIGRRGEALAALQYLMRLMTGRQQPAHSSIIVDVDGHKTRRSQMLRGLANRMADQAVEQQRTLPLEPMPAHERRIIHLALRQRADVETKSVGEGEGRKVTIVPKAKDENAE